MAIADPKDYAKTKEADGPTQFITLTAEQFAQLVGTKQDSDEFLKKQAQYQAEATKRAMRPENETHPGVSVYNPLGERDHPKPPLKCKMFWCGVDEQIEVLTREEVELMNQLMPGSYPFHRTDGSVDKLTVTAESDAYGVWTRMFVDFPATGDARANLPSRVAMLREVLAPVGAR